MTKILLHVDPVPSNSCVNRRQYKSREREREYKESRRVGNSEKVVGRSERHFVAGREKEHRL
jgi:hypothetical protein